MCIRDRAFPVTAVMPITASMGITLLPPVTGLCVRDREEGRGRGKLCAILALHGTLMPPVCNRLTLFQDKNVMGLSSFFFPRSQFHRRPYIGSLVPPDAFAQKDAIDKVYDVR